MLKLILCSNIPQKEKKNLFSENWRQGSISEVPNPKYFKKYIINLRNFLSNCISHTSQVKNIVLSLCLSLWAILSFWTLTSSIILGLEILLKERLPTSQWKHFTCPRRATHDNLNYMKMRCMRYFESASHK